MAWSGRKLHLEECEIHLSTSGRSATVLLDRAADSGRETCWHSQRESNRRVSRTHLHDRVRGSNRERHGANRKGHATVIVSSVYRRRRSATGKVRTQSTRTTRAVSAMFVKTFRGCETERERRLRNVEHVRCALHHRLVCSCARAMYKQQVNLFPLTSAGVGLFGCEQNSAARVDRSRRQQREHMRVCAHTARAGRRARARR